MVKAGISWSARQIARMAEKRTLSFDNALQRGFVWDNAQMSLFVDSMLRDFPVPPFYTIKVEGENGKIYDCIDGKQRCTTICRFRNNEFALGDLEPFPIDNGGEEDISGMKYEELPEEMKDRFDSYTLTVYFFSEIEDHELREMMNRLNNGKAISNYEKARIKAVDLETIARIARHPLFLENLSDKAIRSYINENLVVYSVMLLTEEDPCFESRQVRSFMETLDISTDTEERLNRIFSRIKSIHDSIAEIGYFSIAKKLVTRTHLVSIVPIIDLSIEEGRDDNDIRDFLRSFFNGKPSKSQDYNSCSAYGSGKAKSIRVRLNALEREYRGYFHDQVSA